MKLCALVEATALSLDASSGEYSHGVEHKSGFLVFYFFEKLSKTLVVCSVLSTVLIARSVANDEDSDL